MRVLMVSLDASLLTNSPVGDVLERMKEYADRVERLDILVFSSHPRLKQINEKLRIIGSGGPNKPIQLFLGWRKAMKFAHDKDIITTQDPFFTGLIGWLASRKFNVPLVVDVHGDFFAGGVGSFRLPLAKFLFKKAKQIRVVNKKIKHDLMRIGIKPENIYYQPVQIDLNKFRSYDPKKVKNIRERVGDSRILLFVGRLAVEKNLGNLIEAVSILIKSSAYSKVKLLIVGEGPCRDELIEKVKDNKLQRSVRFVGKVNTDEISNYYHACDIFVLPSRYESFGLVILEAAMAKKPVVATMTAAAKIYTDDYYKHLLSNDKKEGRFIYTVVRDRIFMKTSKKLSEWEYAELNEEQDYGSYQLSEKLKEALLDLERGEAQKVGERLYHLVKRAYGRDRSFAILKVWKEAMK